MNTLLALENKARAFDHGAASASSAIPGLRILLLTPYSGGNLGDGAIQDAVIYHFRKRLSEPQIRLVTSSPRITSKLHGLPSFPIASSVYHDEPPCPGSCIPAHPENRNAGAGYKDRIKRSLRRGTWLYGLIAFAWRSVRRAGSLLMYTPRELRHLFQVYRLLKETDLLVMSGGGQIDDYWGGAFGHPYALFKWTSLARVTNTPVVFLSVGVCSLGSRWSRRFAHRALRRAVYRSYRDRGSKELLRDATFTRADPEYPDLAFSHPCAQEQTFVSHDSSRKNSVIGVSPIAYLSPHVWPERDPIVYERYLQTLCEFTGKVLEAGHTVVLFTSSLMDQVAVTDLQARLQQNPRSESWGGRLQQVGPDLPGQATPGNPQNGQGSRKPAAWNHARAPSRQAHPGHLVRSQGSRSHGRHGPRALLFESPRLHVATTLGWFRSAWVGIAHNLRRRKFKGKGV